VHLRISCPPTISPCYYGVDTPTHDELIAANHSIDEIRQFIGADSLGYLSHEGLLAACGAGDDMKFCTACYTGKYPLSVEKPHPPAPENADATTCADSGGSAKAAAMFSSGSSPLIDIYSASTTSRVED
jgi:glutamine phosphoribosylpyrophosphate amidotransferase